MDRCARQAAGSCRTRCRYSAIAAGTEGECRRRIARARQRTAPDSAPRHPWSRRRPIRAAEATPSTRCRSLGPFDDVNAANAAADRLRTRGMNPHDRSADTVNPNVYWVYIGELTVEMQRRAIQTLNNAGIHDAVAMTQPEQSDRVSVGVFADQAHAVRRAEQVRTLGLKPTLGMRQRTVTAHWIDFELKPAEMDPSLADLTGPVVRSGIGLGPVKFTDCPAGAGNG